MPAGRPGDRSASMQLVERYHQAIHGLCDYWLSDLDEA